MEERRVEEKKVEVVKKPYWDFEHDTRECIPPPNAMVLNLHTYEAVKRVKSIRRAIRRGRVDADGVMFPARPFHNKKNTSKHGDSRSLNTEKKSIYARLKALARREEQL